MTWRKSKLPAELISVDSLAAPPNPWKKDESAKHGTEQTELDASKREKKQRKEREKRRLGLKQLKEKAKCLMELPAQSLERCATSATQGGSSSSESTF